jgi:uncharacterized protein DUF5655
MTTTKLDSGVARHFQGRDPAVRAIYDRILAHARSHAPVREEPKKTSIHLARRTPFAGVSTRHDAVILTLKSTHAILSTRVTKRQQVSANRWHLEVRLTDPKDVDRQLARWIDDSMLLAD